MCVGIARIGVVGAVATKKRILGITRTRVVLSIHCQLPVAEFLKEIKVPVSQIHAGACVMYGCTQTIYSFDSSCHIEKNITLLNCSVPA